MARQRFEMRRERFAAACAVGASLAGTVGIVSLVLWGSGSLLGVGALALGVLLISLSGLTVLIEAEEREHDLVVHEPVVYEPVRVAPVQITSEPFRPRALLPPAPARLLLEPPRQQAS